ncbi:SDR family NAD(P)-dependent oxidoreductase [Thermogymnomonas acidicola]|uniref:SDR family NAD(P)-dependent oxidoreductase n=1 Tax=Thermogymnomonas acidicola TaxID=399579 RepID=UPI0014947827|nr:SDR family NAD(P)-dependent oxidoreductase [Thermogymnomonas acidicola]
MEGIRGGRSAIVTGAGSGIGREIALLFASEGAKVVVAELNEAAGRETERMIRDSGGARPSSSAQTSPWTGGTAHPP